MKLFSWVVLHELAPRKKGKKNIKICSPSFPLLLPSTLTAKPNSQSEASLLLPAQAPCRTGKDNNKILFYTHRHPSFYLHWETECCRHDHASLWHSISGKITIQCCFSGFKTLLQPMKTLFCKKKSMNLTDFHDLPTQLSTNLLCSACAPPVRHGITDRR